MGMITYGDTFEVNSKRRGLFIIMLDRVFLGDTWAQSYEYSAHHIIKSSVSSSPPVATFFITTGSIICLSCWVSAEFGVYWKVEYYWPIQIPIINLSYESLLTDYDLKIQPHDGDVDDEMQVDTSTTRGTSFKCGVSERFSGFYLLG